MVLHSILAIIQEAAPEPPLKKPPLDHLLNRILEEEAGADPPSEKIKYSKMGLCFPVMKKVGDIWRRDEAGAFEKFKLLFDIRKQVQAEYSLVWEDFWHMTAQRRCENILYEHWRDTKEGDLTAKQLKSKFNVYQYQEFGGHEWCRLFWGFGKVDQDHIAFLNAAHWAAVLRKSKYAPRTTDTPHPEPRVSTAGAKPPSDKMPEAAKRGISERKWHLERLQQLRAERIAFSPSLPERQRRNEKGVGRTGGKQGKGHYVKGDRRWVLPSWLMGGKAMTAEEMDEALLEQEEVLAKYEEQRKQRQDEEAAHGGSPLKVAFDKYVEKHGLVMVPEPEAEGKGKGKDHKGKNKDKGRKNREGKGWRR